MVPERRRETPSTDPEERYAAALRDGFLAYADPEAAINRLGVLVDLSCDLDKPDGLRVALGWVDAFVARELSDSQRVRLHYFAGNAWAGLDQLLHQGPDSTWKWERQ